MVKACTMNILRRKAAAFRLNLWKSALAIAGVLFLTPLCHAYPVIISDNAILDSQPRYAMLLGMFMRTVHSARWPATAGLILLSLLYGNARADTQSDLDVTISSLQVAVEQTTTTEKSAVDILAQTNVLDSAMLIGSIEHATAGGTVNWAITFIPGPKPVAALQADFLLPPNVSIISVVAGPAATDAGKSVAFSSGTNRALLFGLNVNPILNGVVAIVTLQLLAASTPGIYPAVMSNPVASDPTGNSIPLCLTSGAIEVP